MNVFLLYYTGTKPVRKILKSSAIPSVFPWKKPVKCRRKLIRHPLKDVKNVHSSNTHKIIAADINIGAQEEVVSFDEDFGIVQSTSSTQTEELNTTSTSEVSTQSATSPYPLLSAERFAFDDRAIHFYTGLESYAKFLFVFNTLGQAVNHLTYMFGAIHNIHPLNQFFLVMIKLRLHKANYELSTLFDISEADVYNICCTWLRFMSLQWRELVIWPSQEVVRTFAPRGFQSTYPTTRVIVDGTECPVQKPKLPVAQQSTYSTYKNRNTVKVLVGVTPGGQVSYVSSAYGGSTSDRQIVERSNLPQYCDTGDSIMADKGFDVQDIFAPYNVTINIPTFFVKKNRMCGDTVLKDRKIASKRVHVERIIGLAKTYKILSEPMNTWETQLSSDIIYVCFMLCNFRTGIVPRHA